MLVITQNTEQVFAQEVHLCVKKAESWRCIILKFSSLLEKPDGWFSDVSQEIQTCLGDSGGRIFLFEDGDLYILSRYATRKSFSHFIGRIAPIFAPNVMEGLSRIYELPIDASMLIGLLEKKRALKKNAQDASQKKSPPPPEIEFAANAYADLTATLPSRRKKRDRPSILIVEDDIFSQRLVAKTLGAEFQVLTAEDGHSALETYIFNAPDMIFLDIGLPDANGIDLIGKIFEADPDAYIIMLSGNGNKDNILKAVDAGAKGFVSKPFARDKLFHYVGKSPFIHEKRLRG